VSAPTTGSCCSQPRPHPPDSNPPNPDSIFPASHYPPGQRRRGRGGEGGWCAGGPKGRRAEVPCYIILGIQAGRVIAAPDANPESRKVRAPQGTTPGNSRDGATCRTRATEKRIARQRARVKRRCKRPPASAVKRTAWQPPSGARPNRGDPPSGGTVLPGPSEPRVGC
jgi:hypothetical protein